MKTNYFKSKVKWLGTEFLFKNTSGNKLSVHFTDEQPFCSCSFTNEHCGDENFANNVGPCPKCFTKCDKHIERYELQSNFDYMKHYSKNKDKFMSCAFCQYEHTHKMDEKTKAFFKTPYPDNPSISFLSKKGIPITDKLEKPHYVNVVGFYNGRKMLAPLSLPKSGNIGAYGGGSSSEEFEFERYNPETGEIEDVAYERSMPQYDSDDFEIIPESYEEDEEGEEDEEDEEGEDDEEPYEEEEESPKQETTTENQPELTEFDPSKYPTIAKYLLAHYIHDRNDFENEYRQKGLKNEMQGYHRTFVGFIKGEDNVIFKIEDYIYGMNEFEIDLAVRGDIYEAVTTNKAFELGVTGRMLYSNVFIKEKMGRDMEKNDIFRVFIVKIMDKVEGTTLNQFMKKYKTDEFINKLTHDLTYMVNEMHERGVIHGDLHGGNILIDGTDDDYTINFIDFTHREYMNDIEGYIKKKTEENPNDQYFLSTAKSYLLRFHDVHNMCWFAFRDLGDYNIPTTLSNTVLQDKNDPHFILYYSVLVGYYFVLYARIISYGLTNKYFVEYSDRTKKAVSTFKSIGDSGEFLINEEYNFYHVIKESITNPDDFKGVDIYQYVSDFISENSGYDAFVFYIITFTALCGLVSRNVFDNNNKKIYSDDVKLKRWFLTRGDSDREFEY